MPKTNDYKIRVADLTDTTDIIVLGKEFYKEFYSDVLNWNSKLAAQNLEAAIEEDPFLVLVIEKENEIVGMLVAMVSQCFFSYDVQASELAWYIEKNHRKTRQAIKLLDLYEDWAKGRGAKLANMMNIEGTPKAIVNLYERRGYKLKENTFIKELS